MIYYMMKTVLFGSLLAAMVKAEPLRKYNLFISLFYTAIVAFLSYVFLLSQFEVVNWELWRNWLILNFVMTAAYFFLLTKFEEGAAFWFLLPLCVVVIFNEPNIIPKWLGFLQSILPFPIERLNIGTGTKG